MARSVLPLDLSRRHWRLTPAGIGTTAGRMRFRLGCLAYASQRWQFVPASMMAQEWV